MQSSLTEVETPAVMVDLDVLERNLQQTAALARSAGVKLRPHAKTHKSPWIAARQLELGAVGLTTAKLSEAEVMFAAGAMDLFVAFPLVGRAKLERLRSLLEIGAAVTVAVDNERVAQGLSELGEAIGRKIAVYVEVNSGLNRCGLEPGEDSARLAKRLVRLPGIEVTGVMTHAGHAYKETDLQRIREIAFQEAEALLSTAKLLERDGIILKEISVGSTPTSKFIGELAGSGVTELRPGAYVFGDGVQLSTGIIDPSQCALHVLTTVVSRPRPGVAIIDAGSKTFSSDVNPHCPGYGIAVDHPGVYVERVTEEHGIVHLPAGCDIEVGEQLRFIPNHCCATVNLHQQLIGIRSGKTERLLDVAARGNIL